MYAFIVVIGMLSPATGSVVPVGVTSQIVGKFTNLDNARRRRVNPLLAALFQIRVFKGALLVLRLYGREVI